MQLHLPKPAVFEHFFLENSRNQHFSQSIAAIAGSSSGEDMLCKMSEFLTNVMKSLEEIGRQSPSIFIFDGRKLKWGKNYDQLQKFIQDLLEIEGMWSCPGGRARRFESQNDELIINYPTKKQNILFQGTDRNDFKNKVTDQLKKVNHTIDENKGERNAIISQCNVSKAALR